MRDIFINECNAITAICLFVKSTEIRFNSFQKYNLSNVMSLFENDVGENFIVIPTFCDGNKSNIVSYLEDEDNIFSKLINKIQNFWYLTFNNWQFF